MKLRTNRNTLIAALVFATLSGVSAISHAIVPTEDYESMRVTYTKPQLDSKQGQQTLYGQLRRAAENVCDEEYSRLDERECAQEALDRAIDDVDHPELSAMHRS